ncbi:MULTISPECIES: hypothetical protein [Mycobacteriaceae]|uniref:Uncharacterized protein n=2 Tax=Mycolicibacterium fortuitum TaxID=1766 RepID=A0AAE4VDU0_MYCFO|nr:MULTISPECIES: hypothetical protein [Mycobacteriaceae]AMU49392.1 hypothetical protein A3O01_03955 [Mycobacteroides abscessus]ANO08064.1 hypothetical protein BAB76_03955 [Mycobacteroides abscessus]MCV7143600.1 hypothetical protein [Mycolicibacterium fortuitum]MDM3921126.1 hypothetical protein [Mycobacteroides abscessus]MDO2965033.1 hypothetical protein [Mycobacteroides abscessus subsp. abscessus]
MNLFKRVSTDPVTHMVLLVVGAVIATALVTIQFFPLRVEGVAPPAAVSYRANVDGACQVTVFGYDGKLWTAEQGSDELRRADGVGDSCTPTVITDRVTVGDHCVRVLRVDGRLYTLPDNDGTGPLELAPAGASTAVTGCRTDPSR